MMWSNIVIVFSFILIYSYIYYKLMRYTKIVNMKIDKKEVSLLEEKDEYILFIMDLSLLLDHIIMDVQKNSSCVKLVEKLLKRNSDILIVSFEDINYKFGRTPVLVKCANKSISTYKIPRNINDSILKEIFKFLEVDVK